MKILQFSGCYTTSVEIAKIVINEGAAQDQAEEKEIYSLDTDTKDEEFFDKMIRLRRSQSVEEDKEYEEESEEDENED